MPSSSRPIWLLTCLLLLAYPVLNFVYWPQVLRSGVLSPDSDSIGIPMYGSVALTLVASPFLLGLTWLCVRRYNPATKIAAFRQDRPYRTALATLLFGGLALLFLAEIVREFMVAQPWRVDQPWYEYLWPAYLALWVPWFIALRAAYMTRPMLPLPM